MVFKEIYMYYDMAGEHFNGKLMKAREIVKGLRTRS